ncbi:unnamed protein product [Orchesella dallaii]|uniref:Uncharacterized protein n=1 Tax=Orchesella dallaii TaxID=48710 RepID=A0ABP1S5B2_9HEXA
MSVVGVTQVLWVLILSILILICNSQVQFYKDAHFIGEMYTVLPTSDCINIPDDFGGVNGSVKISEKGCIAVYMFKDCKWNGYVVNKDERLLADLANKYSAIKSQCFSVSSFRACTDMESSTKVNFDYSEDNGGKVVIPFRDICKCTNLPTFKSKKEWRSVYTYGNCFHRYSKKYCVGEVNTGHEIQDDFFESRWRSIKPCHIPKHCKM